MYLFPKIILGLIVVLVFLPLLWNFRSKRIPAGRIREYFETRRAVMSDRAYKRKLTKKIAETKSAIAIRKMQRKEADPSLNETLKILVQLISGVN